MTRKKTRKRQKQRADTSKIEANNAKSARSKKRELAANRIKRFNIKNGLSEEETPAGYLCSRFPTLFERTLTQDIYCLDEVIIDWKQSYKASIIHHYVWCCWRKEVILEMQNRRIKRAVNKFFDEHQENINRLLYKPPDGLMVRRIVKELFPRDSFAIDSSEK